MKWLTMAMLAALLFATPTFAAQKDDLLVFKSAERQVLQYSHFTIFDSVHAKVEGGVVTLTGKVTMPYKRTDIERRVANSEGVTAVQNKIDVLPVSRFDDELRFLIARAIYSNPNFRHFGSMVNPPIHVIVEHGRVTLEGVVNNETDRLIARSIAGQFASFSIKSELKTVAEAREELEKL